ncbi:MAG: alanine racemase [Anaerolineaceae bacterium]|nr:alanine racemase [Anaerolineaceae bacterium]
MRNSKHPTWININLSAIENNTKYVLKKTGVDVMAVVKTNAYGYGAVEVSKTALKAGATWLAVVRCEEISRLRDAGINAPIMVFGGATPGEVDLAIEQDATLPVYDLELAQVFSRRAQELGKRLRVHVKVDTGLGRFGVFPDDALDFTRRVLEMPGLVLDGIFSHFAVADVNGHPLTALQIRRFKGAVQSLNEAGIFPRWVHLANSPGILHQPQAYFNLVRAGGVLFGLGDVEDERGFPSNLQPAFTWKAQLMSCKRFPAGWKIGYGQTYETSEGEVIGVVPVGHGDGFLRNPGNEVLVDGRKVPVVGKVCMDQSMISLPKMYPLGTEVVLVGEQGDERITPQEVARRWGSSTTAATNINQRVPRVYIRD